MKKGETQILKHGISAELQALVRAPAVFRRFIGISIDSHMKTTSALG
jgi:hypothetical protein